MILESDTGKQTYRQTDRQIYLFDQIEKYNDRYIIESWSGDLH